jgi:hypothetical protein
LKPAGIARDAETQPTNMENGARTTATDIAGEVSKRIIDIAFYTTRDESKPKEIW